MVFIKKVYYTLFKYLIRFLESQDIDLLYFKEDRRKKIFSLIKKIKEEKSFIQHYSEAYNIFRLVESVEKLSGCIAEVGTYEGGSAKLICEAKKDKKLFLFDTFSGLPTIGKVDSTQFHQGQFKSEYEQVKAYLSQYTNVFINKGFFPKENSEVLINEKFSFVHLDVDLYESTYECLNFFYNKMEKGGIILSHDYSLEGVNLAFNSFFKDKPELIIEMLYDQVMVVKL